MEMYHVIALSIVEGITEFLPVSSTAHLVLTSHLLGIPKNDFLSTFEITIQLGAILAVTFLYIRKVIKNRELFLKVIAGFLPTGLLGFILFPFIKGMLSNPVIPVVSLFIGGIAILFIEYYFGKNADLASKKGKTLDQMTYKDSLLIGLIQSMSMIPGVSRAAASIFGGMALSFKRQDAVEFSFLLAIPTMMAATGYDLIKTGGYFSMDQWKIIIIGTLFSFITALAVVTWLLRFVKTNNFVIFGIYRIVASVVYFFLFLK